MTPLWRVETRHTLIDRDGYEHGFSGFVAVDELTDTAILDALLDAYPALRDATGVELTYVEARRNHAPARTRHRTHPSDCGFCGRVAVEL